MEDRSSLLGSIFEVNKGRRAKELRLTSKMAIFLRLKSRLLKFFREIINLNLFLTNINGEIMNWVSLMRLT